MAKRRTPKDQTSSLGEVASEATSPATSLATSGEE